MKPYLILVKHSIPEIQENIPAREWHLSMKGRRRADLLAERLKIHQPEVLISSNEPKAIETAKVLERKLSLPNHVVDNLHEHDRSKIGYLSRNEFERAVQEFFAHPDRLVFGSESGDQAFERFSGAVHAVLNSYKGKTTIIVSHGTVISLFVSRFMGISADELWNELGLPSFVVLDIDSGTMITKENIS